MESGFIKRIGDVIIQRVGPPHGSMTPPPGNPDLDPDEQGEISPELPPGPDFRPELGLDSDVGPDRRIEEEHDLPDEDHDDIEPDRAPMVPSVMDDDFVPDLPEDDLNEDPEPDSREDDENDRSDMMEPHVDDELEEGDDVLAGLKGAGDGVALMESEDLLREIKPEPMEQDGQDEDEEGNDPEEREDEDDLQDDESGKRKQESDNEEEQASKKKKSEEEESEKKKNAINLRRNIREVMDENQLDEATLAAQRQEAERLRRVQDQQKYLREIQMQRQLQIQKNRQARMLSFLQGGSGSASLLKAGQSSQSGRLSPSTKPNTVVVKLGSGGPPQLLNKKVLEAIRSGRSSPTPMDNRSGVPRIINKHMVTPSVSIAPVKPAAMRDGFERKDGRVTPDVVTISSSDEDDEDKPTPVTSVENKVKEEPEDDDDDDCIVISEPSDAEEEEEDVDTNNSGMHTNDLFNCPDEQGRVLINVGKQEGEQEIFLAPQVARVIKPHQIGGVRFLFDNIIESVERYKTSTGFGCILAHSMGLGKTLQVVSFCDIFLRETPGRTIMCIMPINTLQNWVAEFNMWIPTDASSCPLAAQGEVRARNFQIFVLNDLHKTIASRSRVVNEWKKEGGVLLIGYEMYRQLSLKKGRARKGKKKNPDEDVDDVKNKPHLESMHEALVKPGPDLVICDEGHRIKNSHASISHALKQIRTKRRVVLTGYPLQNNLLEYWCMVDFVRPNYLGTKTEFSNMFERPIQNGQCIDSTPQDIRLMRYRAHVLHSLLEGFVQRRSHSVLRNSLPQKEEYVLLVRMSSFQRQLYDTFMNEVVRTKAVPNPLKAFAVCCKIWNHPDILYHFLKKRELDELQDLELEETANLNPNQPPDGNPPRGKGETRGKKGKGKKAPQVPIKPAATVPPTTAQPEIKSESQTANFDFNRDQQNFQGQPPSGEFPAGQTPQGDFKNFNSNFPGNNNYYQNYNSYQNFPQQEGGYSNYNQQQGEFSNFNYYQGSGNFGGGNNFYPSIKKEPEEFPGDKKEEIKFSQQKSLTGGQVVYNAPFGSNEFEPKKEFQQYNEWNQFGQQNYGYQWQPNQQGEAKPKIEDGQQFGGQNVPYPQQQNSNYPPLGESTSNAAGGQGSNPGFSGQPPSVAGPSHEYQQTGYSGQDVNTPNAGFGQSFGPQHQTQGQMGQFPPTYQTQDSQPSQINPVEAQSYGSTSQKNPSFENQGGPSNSQGFGNRAPATGQGFRNPAPSNASQGFGNQAVGSSSQNYGNQATASSNPGFVNQPSGSSNQGFGNQAPAGNAPSFGSQASASSNQVFGNQASGCNTPGFGNQASGSVNPGFGTQTASIQGGNQTPGSVNQGFGTQSPATSNQGFGNQAPGSGTQGYGNQPSRTTSQGFGNQTPGSSSQTFGTQAPGGANPPMQGFGSDYSQTCNPSFPTPNINNPPNNGAESQSYQGFAGHSNPNEGFPQNFGSQPGPSNPSFGNAADQPNQALQQSFPEYSNTQQGNKNIPPSQASGYAPGQAAAAGHSNYSESQPPGSSTQYQADGQSMFSGQDLQRANQSFPQPASSHPPAVQDSDYYRNFPIKNEPGVQAPNPEYSANYPQKPSDFGAQTQNYFGGSAQQQNLFRPHQEPGSQKKETVVPQNPPAYGNEGFSAGSVPAAQVPASNYATQSPMKSQQENYNHMGGKTQDMGGYALGNPADNFGQMGEAQKYQDYQYGNMGSKAPQEGGYQIGNRPNSQDPQRMGNLGPKTPQENQPVSSFGPMSKSPQEVMYGPKKHDQYGGASKNAQEPAMQGFSQGPGKMHDQMGFSQAHPPMGSKMPQDPAYGHQITSKQTNQGTPGPGKPQELTPPYANKQQDPSYRSPGGSKGFSTSQEQYQMGGYGQVSGQPEHLDMNMSGYSAASGESASQSGYGAAAGRNDQSSYGNSNSQEPMGSYGYGVKGAQQSRMGYGQNKIEQPNPGMSMPQEGKSGFAGQGKVQQQYGSSRQQNPSQYPYQDVQGNMGYPVQMDSQGYREYGQGSGQMAQENQMGHGMHSANQGAQMSSQGTQIQPSSYPHQTSQGSQSDPNYYASQNYNYEQASTSYEPREKRGMSCQTEFDKDDRPLDKDVVEDGNKKDDDKKDDDKKAGDALVPVASGKAAKEDMGIPYDWATELLKGYVPGDIHASAKMTVFFCILEESIALGDRILLFSQSLFTLNLMEELLQRQNIPGKDEKWARNLNYYRLDGSTTAIEREKLINEFNSNPKLHLFLVSTRAGSLGINLVGANRVIVFDASWNPCHDTQAVCRVYRYGQKKPCFVYRLVTDNCLEKKIYDRQINKQGMSDRVVDECNPDAHLSIKEVTSLCWDDKADDTEVKDFTDIQDQYIDVVIQKVLQQYSKLLSKEPFQHESLLVDRKEKKLSQAEKRLAKRSYELEKQASTGTSRPLYPNNMVSNQGGIIRRGADKPMASVRPMQSEMGSPMVRGENRPRGWIPASVWQRQGMSAQEMTLPLDVVIPTNAPDRSSIVLKAGQKVMVLKSPKGIYMQLENGKIIAIRTAFKPGGNQPNKEGPKKSTGTGPEPPRRNAPAIPTNLRNNAAVSITPRGPVSSGSGTGPGRSFSQGNRPVRAVGPTHRPSPVSLTVTKKRAPVYDSSVVGGPSSGRLGIPKSDDDVCDNAVSPARPPPSPHHDSRDSMASSSSQYGGSYSNSSRSAPALPSFARDVSITPYASKDHRSHPPANPGMSHVPSGYRDPSYPGQSRAEVSITPYSRDTGLGGPDMRDESRKEYDGGGPHEYRPEARPFASVSLDSHYRHDLGATSGPSLYNPYDDKGHEMMRQAHDPKAAPHHLYHHRPPSTHHEPDVRGYRPDKHQGHPYPPRPDSEKQFQPAEPDKSFMSSQKPPYMQSEKPFIAPDKPHDASFISLDKPPNKPPHFPAGPAKDGPGFERPKGDEPGFAGREADKPFPLRPEAKPAVGTPSPAGYASPPSGPPFYPGYPPPYGPNPFTAAAVSRSSFYPPPPAYYPPFPAYPQHPPPPP